jgi:hypothetical protein|tara:strand:- start:350 stop:1267 length:918 start_codon:yes stop_codon:yes gene_type:complete
MNEEVQNITPDNDIEVKILDDQPKEQEDVSLVQPEENQPQESASDVNEELKSLKSELAELKKEPYSSRVKNRISKEVSKRKVLEDQNKALEERLAKLESNAQEQNKNVLQNTYQKVSQELKEAIEGGNTEKQVELMDQMAEVRSKIQTNQQPVKEETKSQTPEVQVPEIAQKWIGKNSHWWNKPGFNAATQMSYAIDKDLTEEGFDINDPEYYTEMDKRMSKVYPDLVKTEENAVNETKKDVESKPRVQSPVAGVSRSNQGSAKSVRLTSDDLQNAVRFGIDINDQSALKRYAKELANYTGNKGA